MSVLIKTFLLVAQVCAKPMTLHEQHIMNNFIDTNPTLLTKKIL